MEAVIVERSTSPSAVIVSIPHGSSDITLEMQSNMKENVLLTNNDWFLNSLYDFLYKLDIIKVSANYSRYVIDVNRSINKKQTLGDYTESLIYHKTTFGQEIYENPLSSEIINNRIKTIYQPFHSCLLDGINNSLRVKSKVYLFDLHSFYVQSTADIVLGTCNGKACSSELINIVYNSFVSENFSVKIDEKGLRGGFIVSNYSSINNVEAIQIEIRYTAYIEDRYFGEEEVIHKNNELFYKTQERLIRVFKNIKEMLDD
ncbi:N-formylglutamate amidohydrolase [Alkaliphilus peptidifermentans]|uniref:N-formylglutamate amidohydrolase n=1 Tax=Alkaliphilus peptidifermentans DSM 18978 TaxID=1120976 RepID=A0A1G5GXT3_9FIRM|nr:N-formylglutamate amidohydrolase [Alkaliphilus peptidifermentans]SCY56405.1 N-formylglutamate amidohydrolase [Alkaliphilus peptidifermentans DSM 18978]